MHRSNYRNNLVTTNCTYISLKALENKNVLSLDLKLSTEGLSLIALGSEFHRDGAATEKALDPYVLY